MPENVGKERVSEPRANDRRAGTCRKTGALPNLLPNSIPIT
jgi:hypothetical protein